MAAPFRGTCFKEKKNSDIRRFRTYRNGTVLPAVVLPGSDRILFAVKTRPIAILHLFLYRMHFTNASVDCYCEDRIASGSLHCQEVLFPDARSKAMFIGVS